MKTFMFAFLLFFVASAAEAGVSIRQAESGNCIVASDSGARATHVRFRVVTAAGAGKWSKDLKPGACWTLPEAGKVQAMIYSGKRCFKNKAGTCAKFSKQLRLIPKATETATTEAPAVIPTITVEDALRQKLQQCSTDLATCERDRNRVAAAVRHRSAPGNWGNEAYCKRHAKDHDLICRFKHGRGNAFCGPGKSWSKKADRCVPIKRAPGTSRKSVANRVGEQPPWVTITQMQEYFAAQAVRDIKQDEAIKAAQKAADKALRLAQQALNRPSLPGKSTTIHGTSWFGMALQTRGELVAGTEGTFGYLASLVEMKFRLEVGKKLVELMAGIGLATNFTGSGGLSFVAEGVVIVYLNDIVGLGVGYEYAAFKINGSNLGARNGQLNAGFVRIVLKANNWISFPIDVGVGSRTLRQGTDSNTVFVGHAGLRVTFF